MGTNKSTGDSFDIARQVLGTAMAISKEKGLLGGISLSNGWEEVLTSDKLERKEMIYTPVKVSINAGIASAYFDNTDKAVTVTSGALLLSVGDILSFQTVGKATKGNLNIIVTAVTNDTTFTAQKAGGVDIALIVGDVAYAESNALEEGSENFKKWYKGISVPRNVFNFPQIIRVAGTVTRSMAVTNNWDFGSIKEELMRQALMDLTNKFNGIASSSNRTSLTIAGKTIKVAWGLTFFTRNNFDNAWAVIAGTPLNVVDKAAGLLTLDMVNDAFQYTFEQWGSINSIYCSPKQARALAGFENSKVNIIIPDGSNAKTVGGALQVLKSPITVGDNQINNIYVDTRMVVDEVIFFNDAHSVLIPKKDSALIGWKIKEPTEDDDSYRIGAISEYTYYYKNALETSYTLINLG